MDFDSLQILTEIVAMSLALALIVVAFRIRTAFARLDDADLAARMFLHARATRRFLVQFSVAALVLLVLPVSSIAYVILDEDVLLLAHEFGHVAFLAVVLQGMVGLDFAARHANESPLPARGRPAGPRARFP